MPYTPYGVKRGGLGLESGAILRSLVQHLLDQQVSDLII